MMYLSKRNQDLIDYVFNNYVIDIKNKDIYLDELELFTKENKDKNLKLEDKDFKPLN